MTDENELEGQSRRKFLKTTGAVSAAATTGVAGLAGNAVATPRRNFINSISFQQLNQQVGLLNINVSNVSDVLDVSVSDVNVLNFRLVDSTLIEVRITDFIDIGDVQVCVTAALLSGVTGTDCEQNVSL